MIKMNELNYSKKPLEYDIESELSDIDSKSVASEYTNPAKMPIYLLKQSTNIILTGKGNFEAKTFLLRLIKEAYPEVKTDSALNKIWDEALKEWHKLLH